jgi:PDZ domain-containing protein
MVHFHTKVKRLIFTFFLIFFFSVVTFVSLPPDWFFNGHTQFSRSTNPININNVIQLKDDNFSLSNIYITAVGEIHSSTIMEHLLFLLSGDYNKYEKPVQDKSSSEQKLPQIPTDEYSNYMSIITKQSFNNSVYLGYKKNGKELPIGWSGVFVNYLLYRDDKTQLQMGDTILEINKIATPTIKKLKEELLRYKPGDVVKLTVMNNDKLIEVSQTLLPSTNNQPMLGIVPEEYKNATIPSEISINSKNLEGPSAGLMFSLYTNSLLSHTDIPYNHKIAGTGTIDKEGNVGQIGGIEYKLEGAIKDNMEVFFVPKDINDYDTNEKDAISYIKKNPNSMKVIPVSTFDEAFNYLKNYH